MSGPGALNQGGSMSGLGALNQGGSMSGPGALNQAAPGFTASQRYGLKSRREYGDYVLCFVLLESGLYFSTLSHIDGNAQVLRLNMWMFLAVQRPLLKLPLLLQ